MIQWVLRGLGIGATLALLPLAAEAGVYDLTVDRVTIDTGDFKKSGIGYNGSWPGPALRFTEGEDVTINVTNNLDEETSIHWHGLILPFQQDGVPGISFHGIVPGETFTYRFPIVQSGTYWFHSHSGLQEPEGAFGAIVIEPKEREPFRYDRDYVVQLTDKHPHAADRIMRNLKMMPDYYNRQQRTLGDFVADARTHGLGSTLKERRAWGSMRMMPTDIEDVQGYVPLINGQSAAGNWTGPFEPGERVRLRLINSSAMAYFDIRIPGLQMTVVQADGQNVQPVTVDELRIAVAETYDVIVRPTEDRAYTIFAESMGRTAYARGTLAPRPGMTAEVPDMREPPLLTMADMGMSHAGMDHGTMQGMDHGTMQSMDHSAMPGMGQHVMPDGTTMQGTQMPAAGTHQMPDGTMMQGTMPAQQMPAGTHQMPDGSTMPGTAPMPMPMPQPHYHTTPGTSGQAPQGDTMQGMDHAAMTESSRMLRPVDGSAPVMPKGSHTMPDGTVMLGESHAALMASRRSASKTMGGMDHSTMPMPGMQQHVMPDGSSMAGMDHSTMPMPAAEPAGHVMPDGTTMPGMDHSAMPMPAAEPSTHVMPDGTTMPGMDHSAMPMPAAEPATHVMPDGTTMPGMDHSAMPAGAHQMPDGTIMGAGDPVVQTPRKPAAAAQMGHGTMAGMDHSMAPRAADDPFYASGSGLTPVAAQPGGKVLSYADLKAQKPLYADREPTREIEIRLTGNMERYAWSIDGIPYWDAEPIVLNYGERVRFKFVNETMMSHPMHLHGMWSILDNGNGQWNPLKHTVSVAPGSTLYTETEVDASGEWAFHCHLSYHMMAGMFRKVIVQGGPSTTATGS